MSDWEDEDAPAVLPASVPGKWDDEDLDDDEIKDSWDQEEEKKPELVKTISKKKKLKEKIQEKEKDIPIQESLEEKKKRLLQQQLQADLDNAKDLFTGVDISRLTFENINPQSAQEFDDLRVMVTRKFSALEGNTQFFIFIDSLIRDVAVGFSVEVRFNFMKF